MIPPLVVTCNVQTKNGVDEKEVPTFQLRIRTQISSAKNIFKIDVDEMTTTALQLSMDQELWSAKWTKEIEKNYTAETLGCPVFKY